MTGPAKDTIPDATSNPATSEDPVAQLFKTSKTIAVVGLSNRRVRPSYGVAEYLRTAGYRIIPVNPNESEVFGEKSYARLEDIPERVDIVNIFRRTEFIAAVVDAAIRIKARAIWMQEGVIDEEAAKRARKAGLFVIMDSCILKEHVKRFRIR